MATDNGQFEPDNSSGFSDETIRRFLLGGLSGSEQPAFEQRLMIDQALAVRVRLAELELADDYAYESLISGERELLAENFLLSADRERKVGVSRSLRDQFAPAPVSRARPATATYRERLRSIFSFRQPAWRLAFAAVIFILLVGTVWVAVKKEGRIKEEITKHLHRRRSSDPTVPVESSHPPNTSTPEHQPGSSPMPVHEQTPASPSEIISLTPGLSPDGSNIPPVNLPKGDQDIVRLRIDINADQPGPCRAELLTADGQLILNVQSIGDVGSSSTQIDFDVPARLLKPGNYQVRVIRDNAGAKEEVGSYYFRVQ